MDATLAQINAKARRKKFRRTEKRIDAQGGYEHLIIRNPDEKHACLDLFFKQKSVRFETIKLPNIFERDETKAFFHALLDLPDDPHNTALELHALRLNTSGTIVAIAGVSFKNDHIICQFSSIDETKAEDISPGEFLFHLVIETMQKRGFALFDFGIGDQRYKRSWCPVVTEHRDVVIPVTVRGHMASLIIRAIVRIKMMIKNNSAIYALVQRMRLKLSRP
jgi:CelD/BcsL family acetyltransferase involved in cellulose biosynthesis